MLRNDKMPAKDGNNLKLIFYTKCLLAEATADYEASLKLNQKNAQTYPNSRITFYDKGQFIGAIVNYTKALMLNLKNAEAYYNSGITFHDKGQFIRAIANYTEALKLDSKNVKAYCNRGDVYFTQYMLAELVADYNVSLSNDLNKSKNTYDNRGIVRCTQYILAKAIADYSKALAIDPNDSEVRNNLENILSILAHADNTKKNILLSVIETFSAEHQILLLKQCLNAEISLLVANMWTPEVQSNSLRSLENSTLKKICDRLKTLGCTDDFFVSEISPTVSVTANSIFSDKATIIDSKKHNNQFSHVKGEKEKTESAIYKKRSS